MFSQTNKSFESSWNIDSSLISLEHLNLTLLKMKISHEYLLPASSDASLAVPRPRDE